MLPGGYMADKIDIEQYIDYEFGCYYLNGDFPGQWTDEFIEKDIPAMSTDSASRLLNRIGRDQIEELILVLSDMRNDRKHPLVEKIVEGTLMDWYGTDENWRVFQLIVDGIIDNLNYLSLRPDSDGFYRQS
jgi:hypothetical protein